MPLLDPDQLTPGDIILTSNKHPDLYNQAIRAITGSRWDHAVIYLGPREVMGLDGTVTVAPAIAEARSKGFVLSPLERINEGTHDVAHIHFRDLTDTQRDAVVGKVDEMLFWSLGYSWGDVARLGVRRVGGRWPGKSTRRTVFCSEAVDIAYREAGTKFTTRPSDEVAPGDLLEDAINVGARVHIIDAPDDPDELQCGQAGAVLLLLAVLASPWVVAAVYRLVG